MPTSMVSRVAAKSHHLRDGDHYALPTTSTVSFEDFGGSSKSGLVSPIMPKAAENRTHRSSRNEHVSPRSLDQCMHSSDIIPSSANITSSTGIRLLHHLHRHRSQCIMDASIAYSSVKRSSVWISQDHSRRIFLGVGYQRILRDEFYRALARPGSPIPHVGMGECMEHSGKRCTR
jgi:hypothetical protein